MSDQNTAPAKPASEANTDEPALFGEGFYSIYYDGPAGKGVLLVCLKGGRLVGADMGGGVWQGAYRLHENDNVAECVFHFSAGRTLVTGQTLDADVQQRKKLTIPLQMFAGQRCRVDIGFGPVSARGQFIAEPM